VTFLGAALFLAFLLTGAHLLWLLLGSSRHEPSGPTGGTFRASDAGAGIQGFSRNYEGFVAALRQWWRIRVHRRTLHEQGNLFADQVVRDGFAKSAMGTECDLTSAEDEREVTRAREAERRRIELQEQLATATEAVLRADLRREALERELETARGDREHAKNARSAQEKIDLAQKEEELAHLKDDAPLLRGLEMDLAKAVTENRIKVLKMKQPPASKAEAPISLTERKRRALLKIDEDERETLALFKGPRFTQLRAELKNAYDDERARIAHWR